MNNPFTDSNFLLILRSLCSDITSLDRFCFENGVLPSDPAVVQRRLELLQEQEINDCSSLEQLREKVKNGVVQPNGDCYDDKFRALQILEVIMSVIISYTSSF